MAQRDETGKRLAVTAAALMRMLKRSLDMQAALLQEMSETLREEADRVEQGGELSDLHVAEEEPDGLVLPRIAFGAGGSASAHWHAVDTHGIPHADVDDFLRGFHPRWLLEPAFAAVFNRVAAGEVPSVALAHAVVIELESGAEISDWRVVG